MDTQNFSIRSAKINDIPLLLKFIKELAAHEKLLDRVSATEDQLRATLFNDKPYAEAIFGCLDDVPVSFALFFYHYSTYLAKPTMYLEDIFVTPSVRGRGIGRKILAYLANLAFKKNCGRFEWWVLTSNDQAIQFYQSINAKAMDDYTVFRIADDALIKLASEWKSSPVQI